MVVRRNGYIYIYLSNESAQDVYFDNLVVNLKHGPLLEVKNYYAFGMENPALSTKALKPNYNENRYKYNGIEYDTAFGINEFEAHFRDLDPAIGRWTTIDPQIEDGQESISPYASMSNNPILKTDPLGNEDEACCGGLWDAVVETGKQVVVAAAGAANAWSSNQLLGAGRVEANSLSGASIGTQVAYRVGQVVGDAASIVTGVFEDAAAAGGELASVGVATPLAVPVALHGASSISMGAINLIKGAPAPIDNNSSSSKGTETNPLESSRAARRDAMRQENIPTSQQPSSQKNTKAGKVFEYEVPKEGGGTTTKQVQQQTNDANHGPHWEAGTPKLGGQKDGLGRDRLDNQKSKSYYNDQKK
jgi:RHS repeat-associated protein